MLNPIHILSAIYFTIRLITIIPFIPNQVTLLRTFILLSTPLLLLQTPIQQTFPRQCSFTLATLYQHRILHDQTTFLRPDILLYTIFFLASSITQIIPMLVFCITAIILFTQTSYPRSHTPISTTISAPPTLYDTSIYTLLTFSWVSSLINTGHRASLQIQNILPLSTNLTTTVSARHFQRIYQQEALSTPNPSLLRVLTKAYGRRFIIVCLVGIIRYFITFIPPLLLHYILLALQHHNQTLTPIYLSFALLATLLLQTVISHQFFDMLCCTITKIRGALNHSIYKKSATLSIHSRITYTTGQIQNLMATDAFNVAEGSLDLSFVVVIIQQFCIILFMLYNFLGIVPALSVMFLLSIFIPLQMHLIAKTKAFRETASYSTDERVKLVSEGIKGIKLVKLYAWEYPFMNNILNTRYKELGYIQNVAFTQAWNAILVTTLPTFFVITVFATHLAMGNSLQAAVVFPIITMFNIIRPPLIYLPPILLSVARGFASLSRLQSFFHAEELPSLNDGHHSVDQNFLRLTNIDFVAHDASFAWDTTASPLSLTLSSINFEIPQGSLVAIVGPTGSGKSSLLAGLLGELPIVSGKLGVRFNRSISYCDQVPFIQNATLRDNILFGKPFDDHHYWNTIRVCALEPDLEILPAQDYTEIGGRGVNLSGGQKARVSLARAVYSRADICLLDDPLCAVDARVGKSIFTDCIVSALRGTTRLLTTNQIHFAASADVDLVIVVKDGKIMETGSRESLLSKSSSEFSQLVEAAGDVGAGDVLNTTVDDEHVAPHDLAGQKYEEAKVLPIVEELNKVSGESNDESETLVNGKINTDYGSIKVWRLTKQETKEEGRVQLQHYATYLRALGFLRWVVPCLLFSVCTNALNLGMDVWLSKGSEQGQTGNVLFYLGVFMGLGLFSVVSTGGGIFTLTYGSIRAASILHENLLLSVFGAPSSFFHATPDGQIINRFHSDMDKVDSLLVPTITSTLRLILSLLVTLGLMLWATPWLIVFIIPTGAICVYIQEYYRRCSVDVRRLESVAKSPLYSHFSESLDGMVTIRAYKDVQRGSHASSGHSDNLGKVSYATYYANRWLGVRLQAVSSVLIFFATILAVSTNMERLSPGKTGLVLAYIMQMLTATLGAVRQFTLLESQLSSVERISEYCAPSFEREEKGGLEKLYREKRDRLKSTTGSELTELKCNTKVDQLYNGWHRKILRWPKEGRIDYERVQMRYRADLEPALKNISFSIQPGEHIGVVGRTGAGKSSAIHCLFRLHELEKGRILVDGTDISQLRLHDLRSSIGIIPQEPVCFSGTIWSNLDMSGEHDETDVQNALDECGLQSTTNRKITLRDEVAENGSNLSVGMRQLLCLGRVLLKDSRIVVLDEATSCVTNETDEIIQSTLRERMKRCTILTIAHRLHTVMRSDRILVMDRGRIAEIGTPRELLARQSMLSALVDETGPATATHLRLLASMLRHSDLET